MILEVVDVKERVAIYIYICGQQWWVHCWRASFLMSGETQCNYRCYINIVELKL